MKRYASLLVAFLFGASLVLTLSWMGLYSASLQWLKDSDFNLGLGSSREPNPSSFHPNDPRLTEQRGIKHSNFTEAWGISRGEGVKVAVVDSGVAADHPDLSGKIVNQRDFLNDDPVAEDDAGHGTHVAGTIAANTDNGRGIAGGCPDCRLVIAKALDYSGGNRSDIAEAIRWSADEGAEVINVSFAGADTEALRNAINYALGKGAVIVASAPDRNVGALSYPAAYDEVLAVSATSSLYTGVTPEHGDWVDVAAPGKDILSTVPGRKYKRYSGTSYAAPQVTAIAALLTAEGYSPVEVKHRIKNSAVDLGPDGRDPQYGAGRVDAAKAVR